MGLFNIAVDYHGPAKYRSVIDAAVARWEQVIIGDLPDVVSPVHGAIDDLLVRVSVTGIDGSGGVLGSAEADEYLHAGAGGRLPSHATVKFDTADIELLSGTGKLFSLVLHELGHALGIGTVWEEHGLTNGRSYTGAHALTVYRQMTGDASATAVPLEASGGEGTALVHWREDVFFYELMTPYLSLQVGGDPLSALTVASLADLGYSVDMAAAEAFALPLPPSGDPLVLKGKGGPDTLEGGPGGDLIKGKSGSDTLSGGRGDDVIKGGKGFDTIDGGFGADVISGNAGHDEIFGDFGHDTIFGGKGKDRLNGDDGSDALYGGKGKDKLDGGTGNDVMTGGKGADTFIFGNAFGTDTITDFRPGKDKLKFDMLGIGSDTEVLARVSQTAGGTKITFGADEVTLQNVNPWDITSRDIVIG